MKIAISYSLVAKKPFLPVELSWDVTIKNAFW